MSYYTEEFEIMSHDVDANNNVRPSVLVRYMQETANHQMRDRGPTYYELFDQGKSYILIRFACEIFSELHPYDKIQVRTWVCESKGATFVRCHRVLLGERVVAEAYSEWTVVDIDTGRICRVGEIDYSNYEMDQSLELRVPVRIHIPKTLGLKACDDNIVRYSDCDMNLHMNNTNYHDILWNNVPEVEKKRVTAITIRFMRGAYNGAVQKISMAKVGEDFYPQDRDEEAWAFRSLVDGETNVDAVIRCRPVSEV